MYRNLASLFLASTILTAAALTGGATLHAQDAKPSVQEPQYVNDIELIGSDGKLVDLEKVKATHESKMHNHFINVTSSSEQVVANPASTVRAAPDAHFVVKVPAGYENTDPSTLITLKPFVVEKDKRTIPTSTAKAGMFQGAKGSTAADTSIPLTFKKYGQNSIEITPSKPLPPGEYTFPALGIEHCFGVDTK